MVSGKGQTPQPPCWPKVPDSGSYSLAWLGEGVSRIWSVQPSQCPKNVLNLSRYWRELAEKGRRTEAGSHIRHSRAFLPRILRHVEHFKILSLRSRPIRLLKPRTLFGGESLHTKDLRRGFVIRCKLTTNLDNISDPWDL